VKADDNGGMDAQPMTPEPSRELVDLRRRAYGPDADILGDAEALRRLHELESRLRDGDDGEPPSPAPSPAPDPDDSAAGTPDIPPDSAPPFRPWWRRIPLWALFGVTAIVGLCAGLALQGSFTRAPDAVLRPVDGVHVDLEDEWLLSISQWLTLDAAPVQHESFHKLQVLSATGASGTSCLVVTWSNHWSDFSCTPEGLSPVVDFVAYVGGPQPLDDPLPAGTVIRFELNGGVVSVTMRTPSTS
jgi:hypothetical protein